MSDASAFLNTIFASTDAAVSFDLNGTIITDAEEIDRDTIKEHLSELYVSPFTAAGSSFVFGVLEDAELEDVASCRVHPTIVLKKTGEDKLIFVWAFNAPVDDINLSALTDALGMSSADEFIPLPGVEGWELLEITPDHIYSFDDLWAAYVSPVEEAELAGETHEEASVPVGTYGDASVLTAYNEVEYNAPIIITLGPNRESKRWTPKELPAGAFFAKLCQHAEGNKDGPAFVLADMVPGQRFKTSVKALCGVGLDIDTGTPSAAVDAAIKSLGCMAVRYTTHSHGKSKSEIKKDKIVKWAQGREIDEALVHDFLLEIEQWDRSIVDSAEYLGTEHTEKGIVCAISHPPMPKHRVVMLFAEPFVIENEAPSQIEAMKKWAKVPEALAGLLGVPFDTSCTDPCRLFYFPRHAKGKPFEISLFGGPYFDWRTLELDNPLERMVADLGKGKSKSVTDEGRKLGRWSLKRAHGFQIADVIQDNAPDRIRHDTGHGLEIECPFDEDHSNAGDAEDRACLVVNAGEGQSEWFTISCRHETCRNKTNLDMLGKMIRDGWFTEDALEDERFNAILEEDQKPEVAVKIEKQDEAKKDYQSAIAALDQDSSEEEINAAINMMLDAGLTSMAQGKAEIAIKKKLDLPIDLVRKAVSKQRGERIKEEAKNENEYNGRTIFRYKNEFNFDEAFAVCLRGLKKANRTAGTAHGQGARNPLFASMDTTNPELPLYSCMDSEPVRLMSKTDEGVTQVRFEPIGSQTLWAELNEIVTFVRSTDQGDGARGKVPEDVSKQVFEQAYRSLPQAPEVISTPLFLADQTLLNKDGYHYDAARPDFKNLLLVSNGLIRSMPQVPEDPSVEEVEEAVNWIVEELLADFPFLDFDSQGNERREPSLANAMAMLLTPFMRRMINGRTPVFFVYKPQPGTGGTLLGQLPMWLFDGAAGSATRYSQNEEEMQKGLIAAVQEPRSHLFFDDVKDFNNRELLRAITQANVSGRLLGASRNVNVPNRFNWVATGNNTIILDEMRRRVVFIRLNAQMPDATERVFRHPDVSGMGYTQFVQTHRGLAVKHILTMIQYWIKAGSVPFALRRRASFEDWSAKVGGVLQACGVEGFLDNYNVVQTDLDDAANRQFIREFHRKYGVASVQSANALFDWATDVQLNIISGNNDDQKRSRFMKNSLLSMIDRTYSIGEDNFMFQQTMDAEQNLGFQLVRLVRADAEVEAKVAA